MGILSALLKKPKTTPHTTAEQFLLFLQQEQTETLYSFQCSSSEFSFKSHYW